MDRDCHDRWDITMGPWGTLEVPDLESGNMIRDCHDRWDITMGPWGTLEVSDLESGNMIRDCHDRWDSIIGPLVMIRWALSYSLLCYDTLSEWRSPR